MRSLGRFSDPPSESLLALSPPPVSSPSLAISSLILQSPWDVPFGAPAFKRFFPLICRLCLLLLFFFIFLAVFLCFPSDSLILVQRPIWASPSHNRRNLVCNRIRSGALVRASITQIIYRAQDERLLRLVDDLSAVPVQIESHEDLRQNDDEFAACRPWATHLSQKHSGPQSLPCRCNPWPLRPGFFVLGRSEVCENVFGVGPLKTQETAKVPQR